MPITPTLDLDGAEVNIAMVASDGLAVTLTFDVDLTGYAVAADIVNRRSRAVVQAITAILAQSNPGVVTLSLTGAASAPLEGLGLDWYLRLTPQGGQPRVALAGQFHAKAL